MKRAKKKRILLFLILLIVIGDFLVFLLVKNNKQKSKTDKVDNVEQKIISKVEEKTLTEEEKQAKREINDINKQILPKEIKKEDGEVYIYTPKPSDLKK